MKIDVTADDIAAGERGSCDCCPVALAVARAILPLTMPVFVGSEMGKVPYFVRIGPSTNRKYYRDLPQEVNAFISDFDARKPAQPFSFDLPVELEIPSPAVQ